jgi:hypothetical protein
MTSTLIAPSTARTVNIAGLLAAAAGIVIQISTGVDYPTVPPGPIILVVAAAIVASTSRRWASYVGVIVPLFLLVGGTIAFTAGDAADNVQDAGHYLGTIVQWAGELAAFIAGVVPLRASRRLEPVS